MIKKILFIAALGLMFLSMLIGIVGCTGSKKSTVQSDESKTVFLKDTIYKEKRDTVTVTKIETKTETKTEIKFDTIQKDCPKNKIIYKVSGDIEVEGNIKEFNNSKNEWKNRYDSMESEYESERGSRIYYEDLAKQVKTVEVVKKKLPLFWILLFFILGAIFGFITTKKFKL